MSAIYGNESKEDWMSNLNNLINRKIKRPLTIVSDYLLGLKEAIKTLFTSSDQQICWVHFKRNITRNLSKEDAKTFKELLDKIKIASSYEAACFESILQINLMNVYKKKEKF